MILKFESLILFSTAMLQLPLLAASKTTTEATTAGVFEESLPSDTSLRGGAKTYQEEQTNDFPVATGSYSTRKLSSDEQDESAFIFGDCVGPATFLGIPFSASAYDVCTFFQEESEAKLGTCGDPNIALDGQPNHDPVCHARAGGVGGDCHVAFTEPGEWLEYSFNINEEDHLENALFNIVLRLSANKRRTVRVALDNRGDVISKDLVVEGTGFNDFKDVIWERLRIPVRGPERIFVQFVDGLTNFCSIRVEETSLISLAKKELVIPFHATAQKYISFYELSPEKFGSCGPGAVDSQPTKDTICNERGSFCNIGWTEAGEQVVYLIQNPSDEPAEHDVTLRLASLRSGRRVMLQVEGQEETYMVRAGGKGFQHFEDFTITDVTFPAGQSRLIVTFVDKEVNMCSISAQ